MQNVKKCKATIFIALLILGISVDAQELRKPNILWIITDDHRADAIGAYNKAISGKKDSPLGHVESPNIDEFAKEGVLFTKAYCNSPGCAPSRASMHTGMYPWHSGVYGFEKTHVAASHYKGDIPSVMKEQGYNTTYFGKGHIHLYRWENGKICTDDVNHLYNYYAEMQDMRAYGYTDWKQRPVWKKGPKGKKEFWFHPDGTVTSFYIEAKGSVPLADSLTRATYEKEKGIIRHYTNGSRAVLAGESPMPGPLTSDGRITGEFQKYLNNPNATYTAYDGKIVEGVKTSEPQFINLGFHFPHTPVVPPKSFRDKFRNIEYKIPNFSKKEANDLQEIGQLKSWFKHASIDKMTYEEKQNIIRDYYAFCAFGDSLVGEAIHTFRNYCEKQNQEYLIILALGDHGWHLGEQGGASKFGPFDTSNHTTVVVVSSDNKRFPKQTIVDDFIEYVDFAPTFYTTAGVDVATSKFKHLDGYDLGEVVNGKREPRPYVLGGMNQIFGERSYLRSGNFSFSMRTRPGRGKPQESDLLKHIKWPLTTSKNNVEMALYDLRIDPKEQRNVAYDPKYEALSDWFRMKLGKIVLGDNRIECDWSKKEVWDISTFAEGADDKVLNIPAEIIPKIKKQSRKK